MFDVTYIGAFIAGLLSFLSPCILPIVPFYLSYLAGVGMNTLTAGTEISGRLRRKAVISALFFALGVITVFVGLGVVATAFGQALREYFDVLRWIAAAVIVLMGLHFLGVIRIGLLFRQLTSEVGDIKHLGFVGSYVIGFAFAFGWTPCVGPVLAAILFTAAVQDTATQGALLLFVYGAGMTLPFVLAALFIDRFMHWVSRFRRYLGVVEKAMGGFFGFIRTADCEQFHEHHCTMDAGPYSVVWRVRLTRRVLLCIVLLYYFLPVFWGFRFRHLKWATTGCTKHRGCGKPLKICARTCRMPISRESAYCS
jgi:cytochrome c-type biogenesis protein